MISDTTANPTPARRSLELAVNRALVAATQRTILRLTQDVFAPASETRTVRNIFILPSTGNPSRLCACTPWEGNLQRVPCRSLTSHGRFESVIDKLPGTKYVSLGRHW
jgi:hypothetical protein